LVPGEPTEWDLVIQVDDITFYVENYYEEVFSSFDIDYISGFFRKGFVVYPNGQRSSC
jgi:Fe-S cluster assembly iron-binding protein IscA